MAAITTREAWLEAGVQRMAPWFVAIGANKVPPIRVSCAWAKRAGKNKIGWCWHRDVSADGVNEIQISPEKDDAVKVLGILLHELVHASDNGESGHTGYFRRTAQALGLEGKMTATVEGDELVGKLKAIVAELGPYPHAALKPGTRIGKQGTRMLKLICPIHGYTLRTTRKWLEELGFPSCPCGSEMELS
jgi:hypothetical protein